MLRRMFYFTLIAVAWSAGCGQVTTPAPPPAGTPTAPADAKPVLQKITIGLNWFPEAEHGGYYAALVHRYFEDEGLEVTIQPGGPRAPVISQVASGAFDAAVDNADKLLLSRAQQADVVAVFAPIQTSPRCLLLHEESDITSFEQLAQAEGYTLAMNPGQPFAQFLTRKLKLDRLQMVPYPGNIVQFLVDKRMVQQAYTFSEPFLARQNGANPRVLMLSDLGFNTYTSCLLVSRNRATRDRELLSKLVRACQRGWQTYLTDPQETNAYIHAQNPEMSLEVLQFGVEALIPLCPPTDKVAFDWGTMELARWEQLIEQMASSESLRSGLLSAADAFTTELFTPVQ